MGYLSDFSMSERAAAAYASGEMPRSKWTKKAILLAMEENDNAALAEKLADRKYTAEFLRERYLRWSSWHHTSCKYNSTDFFEVYVEDEDAEEPGRVEAALAEWLAEQPQAKEGKEVTAWRKGKLVWQQWVQMSGRRGRYMQREASGWVRQEGNWLCLYDSRGKTRKLLTRRDVNSGSRPRFEK